MLKVDKFLDWSSNAHKHLISHDWKIESNPKYITSCAGLYAIFDAEKGNCLYVGKSSNIKARMTTNNKWHQARKDFERPVIYFYEMKNAQASDIFYLEHLIIGLLKPEWNFSQGEKKTYRKLKTGENYVTREQFLELLKSTQLDRDRLMIALGYLAGFSPGAVCALQWGHINEVGMLVTCQSGKGITRTIPLDKTLTEMLMKFKPKNWRSSDYVFLSRNGKRMDRTMIHTIFKESAKKAGISKMASFITLRNSYGLEMLKLGIDVKTISKNLGTKEFKAIKEHYFAVNETQQNNTFVD